MHVSYLMKRLEWKILPQIQMLTLKEVQQLFFYNLRERSCPNHKVTPSDKYASAQSCLHRTSLNESHIANMFIEIGLRKQAIHKQKMLLYFKHISSY